MRAIHIPGWSRAAVAAISGALCLAVSACYALQPDAGVAATIWPPWVWLLVGVPLARLAWTGERKSLSLAAMLRWGVFLLVFSEEPRSVLRLQPGETAAFAAARRGGHALRVVSLNCAGGNPAAAQEVANRDPDIVLLQETPSCAEVEKLGERLWGRSAGTVWGLDTAILFHGPMQSFPPPRGTSHFVAAEAQLRGLGRVRVVSLRLPPPVVRFDLWSPDCWRDYAENRRIRRERLREIAGYLATVPLDEPVIAGGDFNAPAGDAVFRLLRPRLHDSFAEGETGWGDTALNEFPVSRIDEIWVSRHFRALSVRARRTVNSDYRMVVCDLVLR